jgi:predicted glycogen debranching enzyme
MSDVVRRLSWPDPSKTAPEELLKHEWLVTNGLGGYASGTLAGVVTRGFHGYLVAALPIPLGRMMMFNDLVESVQLDDGSFVQLSGEERVDVPLRAHGAAYLREFRLDNGLPVWTYSIHGAVLEKQVLMVHRQNTVHIRYRTTGSHPLRLTLRPSVNFRRHDDPVDSPLSGKYALTVVEDAFEISSESEIPPLRLLLYGTDISLTMDRTRFQSVVYRTEESRGYAARGDLWSPGFFAASLTSGNSVTLVASTENWSAVRAIDPRYAEDAEKTRRRRLMFLAKPQLREGLAAELVLAADQFIVVPAGRVEDRLRAWAGGDDVRTVIAGYPWFTDWGRDTMISLEGLTLLTGRHEEAGYILRTFSQYVRHGLIPNMFPEGQTQGMYHTADATLWYFHAIARYLEATEDQTLLPQILPILKNVIECHLDGTDFGIKVDPSDGLLRQGAEGYQLTWMDAKVGDWVVTPRRGKAVEINALWYNALRLIEKWLRATDQRDSADLCARHAAKAEESFQKRFWYEEGQYLYDVVDGENGDDHSLRPNQVLAISLDYPILESRRWSRVLDVVKQNLLTPFGLRTLAPSDKGYKRKYDGDLRSRDAAYHQGTVWPWLLGPFVDAWMKVHPDDRDTASTFLERFDEHLGEGAVGSIGEIFDAEPPYTPRGCVAQAWSVAELLRCYAKLQTSEPVRLDRDVPRDKLTKGLQAAAD